MSDRVATLEVLLSADTRKASADLSNFQKQLEKINRDSGKTSVNPSANVPRIFDGISAAQARAATTAAKLATEEQRTATASNQASVVLQRLASEQNRTATTANQAAIAAQRLATEEKNTATAAAKAERAMIQLATAQERAAKASQNGGLGPALPRTLDGLSGSAANLAGTLGIAFGANEVIQFGVEAGKSALALDKADKTLRAVTGSAQAYQTALNTAKQQQELFGGTLQDNIEDLTGLAITAKQSGAELQTLVDLSKRLGTLDPAQGTQGARIALSEALSGDPTSLAKRFEIPRAALAKLRDESVSASEKLLILDQYLNKIGITSETTAGAISDQAKAYNKLGAELDVIKNKISSGLANLFAPVASGTASALGAGDQAKALSEQVLQQAQSFQQYNQVLSEANGQLNTIRATMGPFAGILTALVPTMTQLSEAQYNYAQSLIQSGVSAADATAKAQAMNGVLVSIGEIQAYNATTAELSASAMDVLSNSILRVAGSSPAAEANVLAMVAAWQNGTITSEQLQAALNQLESGLQQQAQASANAAAYENQRRGEIMAGTAATDEATNAADNNSAALVEQAQKSQQAALESQNLANFQNTLASLGNAVAGGLQTAGSAAMAMASQYNIAYDAAFRLINAQAQLGQAKINAQALQDQRAGERDGGSSRTYKQITDTSNRQREEAAAQRAYQQSLETSAQSASRLRSELAGLRKGSVAYYETLQKLNAAEKSAESQAKSGGGATKLSDQQKLNNALLLDEQKYQNKYEDEELKHQQRLLDIQKEYAEKQKEAQQSLDQAKADGRAGFYDNLANIEDNGLRQQLSADYEQAALEAEKIAAEKGADVAEAYLNAKQQALEAQAQRASAIANAEKDGDTNKAEYLKGVDALYREAENKRIEAAKSGDNSIAQQRDAALADEALRYEEAQGKIAESAERSGERQVTAAQLAGKQIDANIARLDKLGQSYDKIAAKTGVSATDTAPATSPVDATGSPVANESGVSVLAALEAIKAAVSSVERAVRNGADQVSSSVAKRAVA